MDWNFTGKYYKKGDKYFIEITGGESSVSDLLAEERNRAYQISFVQNEDGSLTVYIDAKNSYMIDPYSFVYNKESNIAEMDVVVTLVRPQTVYGAIHDRFDELYEPGRPVRENWEDELYQYAVSTINSLSSEEVSHTVSLVYKDGTWIVNNYWGIAVKLGE